VKKDRTQTLLMAVILIVAINVGINFLFMIQPMAGPAGRQTGVTSVTVLPTVCLNVNNPAMTFGALSTGTIDDTDDMDPNPFNLENCGNVDVDITLLAGDALWVAPNDVTSSFFQFKSADGEPGSVDVGGGGYIVSSFTDLPIVPDAAANLAGRLQFEAANDLLYNHVRITVPDEEPAGAKDSTITFTASQS